MINDFSREQIKKVFRRGQGRHSKTIRFQYAHYARHVNTVDLKKLEKTLLYGLQGDRRLLKSTARIQRSFSHTIKNHIDDGLLGSIK